MKIGDKLKPFSLQNENGEIVNIDANFGQPLVIYFYPKDDTPGCTKEACAFRDSFEEFTNAGVTVFGVSADSPKSHLAFKEKYRLPFSLLTDRGNQLRKTWNVPSSLFGLLPGRVTYIFDKKGILLHLFNSQLRAEQHITEALAILQK
jgi:peroxiredoxin Q/BCP